MVSGNYYVVHLASVYVLRFVMVNSRLLTTTNMGQSSQLDTTGDTPETGQSQLDTTGNSPEIWTQQPATTGKAQQAIYSFADASVHTRPSRLALDSRLWLARISTTGTTIPSRRPLGSTVAYVLTSLFLSYSWPDTTSLLLAIVLWSCLFYLLISVVFIVSTVIVNEPPLRCPLWTIDITVPVGSVGGDGANWSCDWCRHIDTWREISLTGAVVVTGIWVVLWLKQLRLITTNTYLYCIINKTVYYLCLCLYIITMYGNNYVIRGR